MGVRQHPLFARWYQMKYNCTNENMPAYKNFGGRGIDYDPRWNDFHTFASDIEDAIGLPPSHKSILERIDNDKGYWIKNLCWSTMKFSANNRQGNVRYSYRRQTLTIVQWCEKYKMPTQKVFGRLARGWTLPEALGLKARKKSKTKSS